MNDIIKPVQKAPSSDPEPQSQAQAAPQPGPVVPAAEPAAQQVPSKPLTLDNPKKRIWLRWLIGIVLSLAILAAAGAIFAYMWYQDALKPVSTEMHNVNFAVESGATVEQIAKGLESDGLVRSSFATQIYMRLNNKDSVKAGNYVLSPNQSVAEITNWLNQGRIDTLRVTILPGRTLKDLKSDLAQYGFDQAEIDAAFKKTWDHPILAAKPANVSIEGYIYPETYFMEADATPEDLIKRSFDEFEKQITAGEYREKLKAHGFDLHQGITLASIVSAEVTIAEDQRKVSQVFQTRLSEGMMLGSDVTYIYAAELLGVEPSTTIDSPYNTRKYSGLPPGAIGNFNLSVLDAVVNPANTTYLFFVAGDDGTTHYSYTYAEHQENITKYCQKACFSN